MLKKLTFTLMGIVLVYAAVAFAMKAGIGVLPVDAAIATIADVSFAVYPVRLIVSVVAFLVGAFGCVMVLETHLMRTPMEGCIQLIAERIGTTMGKLRQKIDIVLVIISVVLTLIFGTDWTLREGTIIAALIFGPAMDFWKKTVFAKKRM